MGVVRMEAVRIALVRRASLHFKQRIHLLLTPILLPELKNIMQHGVLGFWGFGVLVKKLVFLMLMLVYMTFHL